MKIDALTPVLTAAPGGHATCRLRIENTEGGPASYELRVVGFDETFIERPPGNGPLAAGDAEEVDLGFTIPQAFAAGRHWIAVEVASDTPGVRPAVVGITVQVGTIDDVAVAVVPSTVRGRRRGRFHIDVDNRSAAAAELELQGEGPKLDVKLKHDRIRLHAGARIRMRGRVKGPWYWTGEPRQLAFTVTATNKSAPSYAPATFNQRSLLPNSLRTMLILLTIVAVWAGALGAAYLWLQDSEDDTSGDAALIDTNGDGIPDTPGDQLVDTNGDGIVDTPVSELVDTDGDGVPDTPGDQLVDTDGDGVPDTPASEVAEQVANGEDGGDNGANGDNGGSDPPPTHTVVGGTVQAGDTGDDDGVIVTLSPLELGASGPAAAGFVGGGGEARPVKLWPARFGTYDAPGTAPTRQTLSIESDSTGPEGAWQFGDVAIGQRYEVYFAKPGFDSQAFIVEPPEDGSAVELKAELEPAEGGLSGMITGPSGPLGNVEIIVTDGVLTFATSTDTGDAAGQWSLSGISTPGTYTLTASLPGYGTEVMQITLDAGQQLDGINLAMRQGVGSIIGRISSGGVPLGGVTVTASNGAVTRTTTSLTDGDTGLYSFPGLELGGRYTVTASREGYSTQSRVVDLEGNATDVNFVMTRTTAAITGLVVSDRKGPLAGAVIDMRHGELVFESESAAAPDKGSFTVDDLEPGTYRIEFSRFDHRPTSRLVTLAPGEVRDLGQIMLRFRPRSTVDQTGSLDVRVVNSAGTDLTGASVELIDVASDEVVREDRDDAGDQASFTFERVPVGTYRVRVERPPLYRPSTRRVSIGLGPQAIQVPLFLKGQVSGRLIDSLSNNDPDEPVKQLDDYEVVISRINADDTLTEVQRIVVEDGQEPDDDGDIKWESAPNSLTTGRYRVAVSDPPPGYRVENDQVLVRGLPPMEFRIRPAADAPLDLNDLEADLYPDLRGAIRGPVVDPADGSVDWAPINADDLRVALSCDGRQFVPAPELLDGDEDGSPDGYHYTPINLQEANLSGNCTLRVTAAGYETTELALPEPLVPTDGDESTNQVVNVDVRIFPTLEGRVRAPQLDPVDGDVTFAPIDAANLAVGLSCGGRPAVPADELLDTGGGPEPDAYRYFRLTIQNQNLTGRCTLEVTAAGFTPGSLPLPRQLRPTGIDRSPINIVNVALVAPNDVGGVIYWIDRGTPAADRHAAGGVEVDSQGDVIIAFEPAEGDGTEPRITLAPDPLETTTDGDGLWAFLDPKQVFGRTSYVLHQADYDSRTLQLEISEGGARDVADVTPTPTPGLELVDDPTTGINAELDAHGGEIRADLEIRTIKGTPDFPGTEPDVDGFTFDVTGAADYADTFAPLSPGSPNGTAAVDTVDPGTYEATIGVSDHHVLMDPSEGNTESLFQDPGEDLSMSRTYVELATLSVSTLDGANNLIDADVIRVTHTQDPNIGGDPANLTRTNNNANGQATFADLPVNAEAPVSRPVTYIVPLPALPNGFDVENAQYRIGGGPFTDCGPDNCAAVPVTLRAGEETSIQFSIPRFGTLFGDVDGDLDGSAATDDDRLDLRIDDRLRVTVQRIADADGNLLTDPDDPFLADADAGGDGFVFSGAAGFYTIVPADPFYLVDPIIEPPTQHPTIPDPLLYRMINEEDNPVGTWVLASKQGTLDITAHANTAGGTPIEGATVTITGPRGDVTPADNVTDLNGNLVVANLMPGDYTIEIHKTDPVSGDETHFPVIVTVNVPQGDADAARRRVIDAPLPQIGGITGSVGALNDQNELVPVPAAVVTRTCMPAFPDVQVSGPDTTTLENEAPDPDAACRAGTPPGAGDSLYTDDIPGNATGDPIDYLFARIGPGAYTLSFSAAAGYDAPDPTPVTAVPPSTSVAQVNYDALDRTVVVTIPATANGTFTVTLESPTGDDYTPTSPDGRTFTFTGVAPEIGNFTVVADGELYAPVTKTPTVPPGTGNVNVAITLADLVGDVARITGQALKNPPAAGAPLVNEGIVRLMRIDGANLVEVKSAVPDANGGYLFELTTAEAASNYRVRVELAGHSTRDSVVLDPTPGATLTVTPSVVVVALATINITVSGPQPDVVTVEVVQPASQTGLQPVRNGNVFTFRVDPDLNWQFRVSSSAYVTQLVDPAGTIDPTPGQTVNRPVTLVARTVSGTVVRTSPGNPPLVGVGAANVRATATGQTTRTATSAGNGTYSITNFLPGSWVFVGEKIGVGRDRVPNTGTRTIADTDPSISDMNFVLAARGVDVDFTVEDGDGDGVDDVDIVLTKPDGPDQGNAPDVIDTGTTDSDGTVTLDALETDVTSSAPMTWTATAESELTATGQIAFSAIDDGSTIDDLAFTVTVDTITMQIAAAAGTVTGAGSNGADVFACEGATGNCGANTPGVVTDEAAANGAFSLVPTSTGTWRMRALGTNDATSPLTTFTVNANGSLNPAGPFTLALGTPPDP